MFPRQPAVRSYLIEFSEVCDVDHRISFEFGVVGHNHRAMRTLDHGSNRLNNEGAGVAQAVFGDAADSYYRNIC